MATIGPLLPLVYKLSGGSPLILPLLEAVLKTLCQLIDDQCEACRCLHLINSGGASAVVTICCCESSTPAQNQAP